MLGIFTIAAVVGVLGLGAGAAMADEGAPSACAVQYQAERAQEHKDGPRIEAILAETNMRGFPALYARLEELKVLFAHAPAHPVVECDGVRHVRSSGSPSAVLLMLTAHLPQTKDAPRVMVEKPSPYALAALLIGSAAVERGDWAGADGVMARGLEFDPGNVQMVGEEALVLSHLNRPADAVALCDNAVGRDPQMDAANHARLLRTKGFALGDLDRFDDAIAAYQESLRFEPGHGGALNEIAYLTKRRAGAGKVKDTTFHSDQAKVLKPEN